MKNLLFASIVIGLTAGPAMATAPEMSEKGFAPAYIGAGYVNAHNSNASASEGALFGAYRTPAIDQPVTVRGYILPKDEVEFGAELTYDYAAAAGLNVFAGPGFVSGSDQTFPTLGLGVEYNQPETPVVVVSSYKRAFNTDGGDGFGLFSLGVGYQF